MIERESFDFVFIYLLIYIYFVSRQFGERGLPEHSINIKIKGSAGQSFCAFMTKGIHVTLEGDANDYVGKVCMRVYCCVTFDHVDIIC